MHGLETIVQMNQNPNIKSRSLPAGLFTVVIDELEAVAWGPAGPTEFKHKETHVVEIYPAEYGRNNFDAITPEEWAGLAMSEVTDGDSFEGHRLILVSRDAIDLVDLDAE
jgi:hypothetical protein